MIPRYTRPEMQQLWSDESRWSLWREIEALSSESLSKLGIAAATSLPTSTEHRQAGAGDSKDNQVPASLADAIRGCKILPDRINTLEAEVKHDVIAFVTSLTEQLGAEGRFVHLGLTSSDIVDTAFAVLLKRAGEKILVELERFIEALSARASQERDTICMGRTHGIHAEPMVFGQKLLSHVAEFKRRRGDLEEAIKRIAFGKLSGPVGTYSGVSPEVESFVLTSLGLAVEPVATQVIPRDRHAYFFTALALLGASMERFAVELRHLQRTEVSEIEEGFSAGQKGSSAMPHKKNPISAENLTGLARLLRGYAFTALENNALWHERDISHSSAERMIGPDATTTAHYMMYRATELVKNLVVKRERLQGNLEATGGIYASASILNALADAGLAREEAYKIVQAHAHAGMQGGPTFRVRVSQDPRVVQLLGAARLEQLFGLGRFGKYSQQIFERVLGA